MLRPLDRLPDTFSASGLRSTPARLKLPAHTFAPLALQAGRSVRWVADQLGHANPPLILRVYAHALPSEAGTLRSSTSERPRSCRIDPNGSIRLWRATAKTTNCTTPRK
jgi:integrase